MDLSNAIQGYFQGHSLPHYFSLSNIVLIPKTVDHFKSIQYKPISLTTVIGKIIRKIILGRLQPHLSNIVTPNQAIFVKGRSIADIVLLAQEIFLDLDKPYRGGNLFYKLDIRRWLNDNAHFIFTNGRSHGCFTASRGLQQRDPLSPTIIILAMDYLSILLNKAILSHQYSRYHHESNLDISRLIYADAFMIFSEANKAVMKK
ncbi:uncharacterized protein LOC110037797, partial [Phalaenopsis equestris]|uniref:uncharacterized protein LOC110037797 n=1 Tax=Phalaenopsis equestris TaxID=78828 RepID=UPI0009E49337